MHLAPVNHVQYFSPAPAVMGLPLHCLDAGAAHIPPGLGYPPVPEAHPQAFRTVAVTGRTLSEYQLVYIARGEGWFECSSIPPAGEEAALRRFPRGKTLRYRIGARTALLLRPEEWHRYAPVVDTGWQEYWVGFNGEGVTRLLNVLGLDSTHMIALSYAAGEEMEQLFSRALALAVQPATIEQTELAGLAQEMLARVARAGGGGYDGRAVESDPVADRRFERAREVMLQQIDGAVEMVRLEAAAGCSKSTLQRVFRRRTGMSPYHYYLALKINAAKWELAHTDRSIKLIAREYGFTDQYHFSRVFAAIAGLRPSRWRSDHHARTERIWNGKRERL